VKQAIQFFATQSDLLEILASLEDEQPVKYVVAGMASLPSVVTFQSATDIDGLGVASSGDHAQEKTFLIAPAGTKVLAREVPQKRGGVLFSFDQRKNVDTIGIRFGGRFDDQTLICGQLGPSTGSPASDMLHALFLGELRRRFVRIKSYWVGRKAAICLRQGFRLTANVRASKEYDLQA
jgi:hypothetical protein